MKHIVNNKTKAACDTRQSPHVGRVVCFYLETEIGKICGSTIKAVLHATGGDMSQHTKYNL